MGAALHWLQPGQKRPIAEGWSTAPRAKRTDLERQHIEGANVGIRLGEPSKTPAGYLHLIDLDIRKPEAEADAWAAARRLVPTLDQLPMVISGSGTGRHFYFFSPTPLRSEKLAKGVGWEIELFGTGKQAVLPPSIHPDTGQPYRWQRPIVRELVDLGVAPTLTFRQDARPAAEEAEDEWDWAKPDPDWPRIIKALGKVKDASDRDTWLKIGMALKDVSSGSEEHAAEGFRLWCAWSKRCPDKYSEKAQRQTWRSFKRSGTGIGTLFQIAKEWGWTGETETPPAPPSRFAFLSPADCEAAPSRGYVIKGLIAPGDVGCIFGAPGAGKSLLSPFLAYAVAQGREAFGQRVRAGGAFYVAAEDPHGMRGRVRALKAAYGDAPGFQLVEGVSNLHPDAPDLVALIEAVQTRKPSIVFVDTLAMAFPGLEENSAESMGNVVAVARKLAEGGAAVVLVHHDTKAEGGTPRGHSILNGALDVALHVKRDEESSIVRARLKKNRNGPCDLDIAFSIATEDGGTDEDGDTITLPRCRELSADPMRLKLTPSEAAAAHILKCILADDASGLIPESRWRDACMVEGALSDSPNKESRGRVFRRVRDALGGQGVIVRFVPDGFAEMHVRMSDFSWADAFDDLPGQGGQGTDNARSPGDTAARLDGTEGRTTGGHTPLGVPQCPAPCISPDPLTELLG
jgi:archaellum biogenesis ATPase FlaH